MPKIMEEPVTPIEVRLFTSDLNKLRQLFAGNVGVNKAIRTIVRTYMRQVEAKAATEIDQAEAKDTAAIGLGTVSGDQL